jgi:hypothetical protein
MQEENKRKFNADRASNVYAHAHLFVFSIVV